MNKISFLLSLLLFASCAKETTLIWTENPLDPQTGLYTHEILVCNPPQNTDWDMWALIYYRSFPIELPESDMSIELYDGHEFVMKPKAVKDTLRLLYTVNGTMNWGHYPHGFILRDGKKIRNIKITHNPLPFEPIPDGKYFKKELGAADIIPQPKNVEYLEGETELGDPEIVMVKGQKPAWYKLTVNGRITIEASDEEGVRYAKNTLSQIAAGEKVGKDEKVGKVGNVVIEDWPDFQYRVQHLDCARCFYEVKDVKKIIDLIAHCKMNYLHLHVSDDEGWRVEIDGLPELTSYGAFHALPELQEDGSYKCPVAPAPAVDALVRGDRYVGSNGYYTREDFKEILRYAAEHGITVIPEYDYPAHSRACVMAMEHRYETTGDATYLLTDYADTSKYLSIQKYSHNVMNVALPSTYAFVEKVLDETARLYEEVGLKLEIVHIGGDEVPTGAWMGSPACQKFMAENGFTTKSELMQHFLTRYADMLIERGIGMTGWCSMTKNFNDEGLKKVIAASPFMMSPWPQNDGYEKALRPINHSNSGIKILVGSADYWYLDNAYTTSRAEHGMVWCGPNDERKVFNFRPYEIHVVPTAKDLQTYGADFKFEAEFKHPENIVGTVVSLWGDVIFDFDMASERLLPKAIGAYERSWNARPEGKKACFNRFYSIVCEKTVPYLDELGLKYRTPMKAE